MPSGETETQDMMIKWLGQNQSELHLMWHVNKYMQALHNSNRERGYAKQNLISTKKSKFTVPAGLTSQEHVCPFKHFVH